MPERVGAETAMRNEPIMENRRFCIPDSIATNMPAVNSL
jgi:hypothetical protein